MGLYSSKESQRRNTSEMTRNMIEQLSSDQHDVRIDDGGRSQAHLFHAEASSGIFSQGNQYHLTSDGGDNNTVIGQQMKIQHIYPPAPAVEPSQSLTFEAIRNSLRILYGSQEAWIIPLPWLPDTRLEPEDYFIDLEMEELSRGGKSVKNSTILLDDILKATQLHPKEPPLDPPTRVLIRGEAGFGKSTLCTKLAYDWSIKNKACFVVQFFLVIMYRLRDLPKDCSLCDELIRFCHSHGQCSDIEQTRNSLVKNGRNILLILDGYDEAEKREFVDEIVGAAPPGGRQSPFRSSTIIVTSRTIEDTAYLTMFQRHIRITGLSMDNRKTFVERFLKKDSKIGSGNLPDKLDALMYRYRFFTSLSPFLLYILCYLHTEMDLATLDSLQELMEAMIDLLSKRCCQREKLNFDQRHLDDVFNRLGELFFENLKKKKFVLSREDLKLKFKDNASFTLAEKCGILKEPASFRNNTDELEPVHTLFMECLATKFLRGKYNSNISSSDKSQLNLMTVCGRALKFAIKKPHLYVSSISHLLVSRTDVYSIFFCCDLSNERLRPNRLHWFFMEEDFGEGLDTGTLKHPVATSFPVQIKLIKETSKGFFKGSSAILPFGISYRRRLGLLVEKTGNVEVTIYFADNKLKSIGRNMIQFHFGRHQLNEDVPWKGIVSYWMVPTINQFQIMIFDEEELKMGNVFTRHVSLTKNLIDLRTTYAWFQHFCHEVLKCSEPMLEVKAGHLTSGRFLIALITSLSSIPGTKWCRFDLTPFHWSKAYAIDCLIGRGKVKLILLEGKNCSEVIQLETLKKNRKLYSNKLKFGFYNNGPHRMFLMIRKNETNETGPGLGVGEGVGVGESRIETMTSTSWEENSTREESKAQNGLCSVCYFSDRNLQSTN